MFLLHCDLVLIVNALHDSKSLHFSTKMNEIPRYKLISNMTYNGLFGFGTCFLGKHQVINFGIKFEVVIAKCNLLSTLQCSTKKPFEYKFELT